MCYRFSTSITLLSLRLWKGLSFFIFYQIYFIQEGLSFGGKKKSACWKFPSLDKLCVFVCVCVCVCMCLCVCVCVLETIKYRSGLRKKACIKKEEGGEKSIKGRIFPLAVDIPFWSRKISTTWRF